MDLRGRWCTALCPATIGFAAGMWVKAFLLPWHVALMCHVYGGDSSVLHGGGQCHGFMSLTTVIFLFHCIHMCL